MSRSLPDWLPRSLHTIAAGYDGRTFLSDLIAGVTVGLVALPLAMAFAIASGLTPQAGIYCAIITGFLISALGGSRFQIGGPTGAFVVVIAGRQARCARLNSTSASVRKISARAFRRRWIAPRRPCGRCAARR